MDRTRTATSRYRWTLHADGRPELHEQRARAALAAITEDQHAATGGFRPPHVEDETITRVLAPNPLNLLAAIWREEPTDPWAAWPMFIYEEIPC